VRSGRDDNFVVRFTLSILEERPYFLANELSSRPEIACKSGTPEIRFAPQEGAKTNQEIEVMLAFIKELWTFLRVRKKLWITPVISVIVIVTALLIVAQGSVLAPFIYSLF
jgi:Family of unknown function (DUF5989)